MATSGAVGDGPSVARVNLHSDNSGSVQVADPEMLFLGDYSRQGHDLVIEHGGATLLVEDYFAGAGANLVGPNGAFLTPGLVKALAGPLAPGQYAQAADTPAATALVQIGKVVSVEGTATATHADGVTVDLAVDAPVYQGDVVRTGAGSKLGISFIDDSVFSMSADARMVLDELVFDPAKAADSSMVVSLVQGSFVFVTGQVAPAGDMKVETPVATMGIRGTTPKVLVDTNLGVTEFSILPDPDSGKIGSYLLLDKTTGEILGTVESVGDKWVITSLSGEAVKVAKSGVDLLEDEAAMADIRDAVSRALGERTEYNGSNSFQQVAFNSSSAAGNQDGGTGGDGGVPGGGDGGVVDPTPDKDDPPIAGDDAFFTNEDVGIVANVINASGDGPDADPDGFAVTVAQVNGVTLTFAGNTASVLLPANADLQTVGANLLISKTGGITYDPTSAFNFLAVGEYRVESFTYTITDKFGFTDTATVNITVEGRNDAPEITEGPASTTLAESSEAGGVGGGFVGGPTAGTLAFNDVDISDAGHTYQVVSVAENRSGGAPPSPLGGSGLLAMLNTDGSSDDGATGTGGTIVWNFTGTENQFDYLSAGESVTLVYTVQVTDPHGATDTQTVTVTIIGAADDGSNDAPTITVEAGDSAAAARFETNAELTASGTLTVNEVDLTNEIDLAVTSVSAGGTGPASGRPSNADLLDMLSVPAAILTDATSVTEGFTWNFDSNGEAFDYLAVGETLVLSYTIRATDNFNAFDDQTVTITITGTNDAPVIDVIGQTDLAEQTDTAALATNIDVTFTDVDLNDIGHAATITAAAADGVTTGLALNETALIALVTPGTVTKNAGSDDGSVTLAFSADSTDFDYLAEDEVVTLTYTVEIDDGDGGVATQMFVVEITGTNDAPVITSAAGGAELDETANQTGEPLPALAADGTIAFRDVDVSENTHTVSVAVEATGVTTGLALDNPALLVLFETLVNQTGAIDIDGSVDWTFKAPDQAFDYLAEDEVLTLTYTVTITDEEGATVSQDVTITVTGANDAPTIEASSVLADTIGEQTDEIGSADVLTAEGTIAFSDVDVTDTHGVPTPTFISAMWSDGAETSGDVNPGALVLGPVDQTANSAAWTYSVADSALDYLAEGETLTITYTVAVQDDSAVAASQTSETQQIVITITGTNDAPVLTATTGEDAGSITEAVDTQSDEGTLDFADVDLTDRPEPSAALQSLTALDVDGDPFVLTSDQQDAVEQAFSVALGSGSLNNGTVNWTFDLDGYDLSFLGAGEVVTAIFTVSVDDGNGGIATQDVEITINGANGGDRDDTLFGTAGEDALFGGLGNDTLHGLGARDYLEGGEGTDTLYGGEGDDWLVGGAGADTYHGGGTGPDQFDAISFRDETGTAGVYANLTTGEVTDTYGNVESATGIEEVDGSANDDVLIGNEADNFFRGGDGADSFDGGDGDFDQVSFDDETGGNGVVVNLALGLGTDTWGNAETLTSIEVLRGSQWDDELIGDDGNNTFRGMAGNDTIDGGDGWDTVRYDRDINRGGDNGVTVDLAAGTATDGFGHNDTLSNIEHARGTQFADTLSGDEDYNQLVGFGGDDTLLGNAGDDQLFGGDGSDDLTGGFGSDEFILYAGESGIDDILDFEIGGDSISLYGYDETTTVIGLADNGSGGSNLMVDGQAVASLADVSFETDLVIDYTDHHVITMMATV